MPSWPDSSLWVIWTGMAEYGPWHDLDQGEVMHIVEQFRSGGRVWLWGVNGVLWLSVYWCQTDICTAVVDPISQFTGAGMLEGFSAAYSESTLSLSSSCILGYDGSAVLLGNHNICAGRATVYEDDVYGYKTAVFNVNPQHFSVRNDLRQLVIIMTQNYFHIYTAAIEDYPSKPFVFKLEDNYPNPFNSRTVVSYSLSSPSQVRLCIYDILGNKIVTLVDQKQNAGNYQVVWDASTLASGVYFCTIYTGLVSSTKKMLLVR